MKSNQTHNIQKQQHNSFPMTGYSSKSDKWFRKALEGWGRGGVRGNYYPFNRNRVKLNTLLLTSLFLLSEFFFFHQLYSKLFYGYLLYILFMCFIFNQHLLSVYCVTFQQPGLIVIKSKAFSNNTLFFIFPAPIFRLFTKLLYARILAFNATNYVMISPPKLYFIIPLTFLFFPDDIGLPLSLE